MVRRAALSFAKRLVALDDTPERIALAFAVGVFLAFSPLLGLHTFLALCCGFLFGLNRVALLVGVFVNNPWTLVPIYAAGNYLGGLLIGFPDFSLPSLATIGRLEFWLQLFDQWRLLMPMMVGSTILSVVAAIVSYPIALLVLRYARERKRLAWEPVRDL
jgi:uncharacterized protein (DUF2062 family)